MEFAHGVLLVLAPLVAACILLLHAYGARARVRALAAVSSVSGRFRRVAGGRRWAAWCTAISGALLGAALAQPLGGFTTGAAEREGRDVLVVVDVSLSMFARDHEGMSRAEVARGAVDQLIDRLSASGGHRLSLLAFAGRASLLMPPALDYDAFRARYRDVGPHNISRRGTRVDTGLAAALGSVSPGDEEYTDVVLVSDGEDHGTALRQAGRSLRATNVAVHVLGVGAPGMPAAVRIPTADGPDAPLLYQGQPVRSIADHASLRDLTAFTDGTFCALVQEDCVGDVFEAIDSSPRRPVSLDVLERSRRPLYQWLVFPALLMLVGGVIVERLR